MKSVRVGRNNRRLRVEGQDCDDWMAVDMGEHCMSSVQYITWTHASACSHPCILIRIAVAKCSHS